MTATTHDDTAPRRTAQDLEPVRLALLADATAEADRITAAARQEVAAIITGAEHERDAEIERVRQRSESSARTHARNTLARARNEARTVVLHQQEALRRHLIDLVRAEALELRNDPHYPEVLDRLESMARAQLGNDATIDRDPDPVGGIIADHGTRRVDYSLPAIADRAVTAIAEEAAQLWT